MFYCFRDCARWIIIMTNMFLLALLALFVVVSGILMWSPETTVKWSNQLVLPRINKQLSHSTHAMIVEEFAIATYPFLLSLFVGSMCGIPMCLFGIISAAKKSRQLLVVYLAIHIVLLLAQLATILVFFVRPNFFNETFRQLLKKSMDYYVDEDSDNAYTVLGDYIMMKHQCCGFNGGEDFKNSKFFKRKNTNATIEMRKHGYMALIVFNYPSACCKPVNNSQELAACKNNTTTENSNIAVGCWQPFRQQLADNLRVVMYTWIAIIGVQVICLFACILALVIDIRGEAYMYTFGNEAWADVVSL